MGWNVKLKNVFVIVVLALFLIVLGFAIYHPITQQDNSEITIGVFSKSMGNSPYYIAKHFEWFENDPFLEGIKFNYIEFNDRPAISDAFARGDLHAVFSAEVPSMLINAQGNDVRAVYISAVLTQEIIVPNQSKIENVMDLKGKGVAVLAGTSSHYCLLKILSDKNISMKDVNIKFISPAEAKTAFETNQLDAWAVWAPWVEQQQVTGKGRSIEDAQGCGIISVMTMSNSLLEKDSKRAHALIATIDRAKKWIAENPTEAQQIVAKELELDIKVVERAWPKFDYSALLNENLIKDIDKKAEFLSQQNLTRNNKRLNVREEYLYFGWLK